MILNDPHDHLEEIEQQFQTLIQNWKTGSTAHLYSFYEPPGGGKTWLLEHWKKKWGGVLLDLSENASTPTEYIRRAQERLARAAGRYILYLDNVPVILDERIQAFQEEILQPALQSGGLVIQCQIHPNQTCWGGAIPHTTPTPIPGLTQAGILALRKQYGLSDPLNATEQILFSCNGALPGLVTTWCQGLRDKKTGQTILRDYLYNWWARFEAPVTSGFSTQLYPYAMLACCNLVDMNELLRLLPAGEKARLEGAGISFAERGLQLILKLKRLQWVQTDNSWYPPIAAVLKTWLSLRNPNLYQALTS